MKFLLALLVCFSSVVLAQTRIVSIDAFDLAYNGGLAFKNDKAKSGDDRKQTTFKLNLNYAQEIKHNPGLMWKAQVNFNRVDEDYGSRDVLESTFGVAGGVLYNFNAEDVKNSALASVIVGIERGTYKFSGGDDESGFNFLLGLEGGKRWDLGHYSVANISYAPTVAFLVKRYGGDVRDHYFKSGRELRFNFLKFDILF